MNMEYNSNKRLFLKPHMFRNVNLAKYRRYSNVDTDPREKVVNLSSTSPSPLPVIEIPEKPEIRNIVLEGITKSQH